MKVQNGQSGLKQTFFKMLPFGIFQNFISEICSFILTHRWYFYITVTVFCTMSVAVFST